MDEPLRILHVVTHMNRGGLETMIMNYYREIDKNKIQFDFLTHRNEEKDYDEEIKDLGGRIYNLPPLNPLDPKYRLSLEQFFKGHQEYSIVHCHLDTMSAYPLSVAKRYNIPVRIAHSHTAIQIIDYKYPFRMISKVVIPLYANKLFACGKNAGEWMFPNKSFETLKNAIALNRYVYNPVSACSKKKELGIEKKYVIGHVGSFSATKNHDYLIDVFKNVIEKKPDSILMLVGEGNLESKIRKKVKKLSLANSVIFMGQRADIPELLEAMDLFMFPSLYEGLGLAFIEAQASGLPCIISDKVPTEASIASNIVSLSLGNSMEWANRAIRESNRVSRANNIEAMKKSGYDIRENALWLEKFYVEAVRK